MLINMCCDFDTIENINIQRLLNAYNLRICTDFIGGTLDKQVISQDSTVLGTVPRDYTYNDVLDFIKNKGLIKNTLTIPISEKELNLIEQGIKKEYYLEINSRNLSKFCTQLEIFKPNKYNNFDIGFHLKWNSELNYELLKFVSSELILIFKTPEITIDYGKKEYGAEEGKIYFVVTWK